MSGFCKIVHILDNIFVLGIVYSGCIKGGCNIFSISIHTMKYYVLHLMMYMHFSFMFQLYVKQLLPALLTPVSKHSDSVLR